MEVDSQAMEIEEEVQRMKYGFIICFHGVRKTYLYDSLAEAQE